MTEPIDTRQVQALPNHHPLWANPAEDAGAVPADLALNNLTLVLSRSPQQEAAFEQFLADQQDPASPNYHHWLTPAEVGARFGLVEQDIETITNWLQTQGLHVNWVAPGRVFIGFGGTATAIGRAFQTELRYYNVNGEQRMSVNSDPLIPQAVAPAIKAIRGLYSIEENPLHYEKAATSRAANSVSPELGGGSSFDLGPSDFNTIYDVPSSLTGAGVTVGIVGESRTDFADFANFRSMTGATFANPTEIIPTAYGGVDPGPAATTCCSPTPSQGEATLDVFRVGSVAPSSPILLVVATAASGGIDDAMQYLVNTTPLPAQVMSISWGGCELNGGSGTDSYYSTLFQTAAGEGISVFVSSGDSGASACDQAFTTPPASPQANSINFICSSSYATCVGGTEFNDASDYSAYWNTSTGAALGYIPEGAWNESWDGSTSSVAASGGGVSLYIATPSWQTGTGVPAARAGRYTPDVSFSASNHDGYFGCFAAGDGSCVVTDGSYSFEIFSGTSAAAPGMAGVAALLDQKIGSAQGDLNPVLYPLAASVPSAFHDVTVASSGVSSCSVNTSSMCNNSIPGPSGLTGGQAGFLVTNGYDEVTGVHQQHSTHGHAHFHQFQPVHDIERDCDRWNPDRVCRHASRRYRHSHLQSGHDGRGQLHPERWNLLHLGACVLAPNGRQLHDGNLRRKRNLSVVDFQHRHRDRDGFIPDHADRHGDPGVLPNHHGTVRSGDRGCQRRIRQPNPDRFCETEQRHLYLGSYYANRRIGDHHRPGREPGCR
ncbi:MAG: S53 family peptidase [Acidobacteriaceae bacterium]